MPNSNMYYITLKKNKFSKNSCKILFQNTEIINETKISLKVIIKIDTRHIQYILICIIVCDIKKINK